MRNTNWHRKTETDAFGRSGSVLLSADGRWKITDENRISPEYLYELQEIEKGQWTRRAAANTIEQLKRVKNAVDIFDQLKNEGFNIGYVTERCQIVVAHDTKEVPRETIDAIAALNREVTAILIHVIESRE